MSRFAHEFMKYVVSMEKKNALKGKIPPREKITINIKRRSVKFKKGCLSDEQERIKWKAYEGAIRCIEYAKNDLKKAGKDGICFVDARYVRRAGGTAYKGVTLALDAWLKLKGVELPEDKARKTANFYRWEIDKRDEKLARDFKVAYDTLYLSSYCDASLLSSNMKGGLYAADLIINRIKPTEAL